MILFLRGLAGFCNVLPGFVWALLFAGALGAATVEKLQVTHYKGLLSAEQTARKAETAERLQVALKATESNRAIETERNYHAQQIVAAVTSEMQKTAAVRATLNAANDRLRTLAANAASGGGTVSGQPATVASSERVSAALGELYGSCLDLATDLGNKAELLAAQVRGLQDAYNSLK